MLLQKGAKLARNVQVVAYGIIWRTIFKSYIKGLMQQLLAAPVWRSGLVRARTKIEASLG
ncbi:MAG: hypothetical protein ACI95C_002383 [Pseudohongiellaceae bacterium]|jgi:hypothetical protein